MDNSHIKNNEPIKINRRSFLKIFGGFGTGAALAALAGQAEAEELSNIFNIDPERLFNTCREYGLNLWFIMNNRREVPIDTRTSKEEFNEIISSGVRYLSISNEIIEKSNETEAIIGEVKSLMNGILVNTLNPLLGSKYIDTQEQSITPIEEFRFIQKMFYGYAEGRIEQIVLLNRYLVEDKNENRYETYIFLEKRNDNVTVTPVLKQIVGRDQSSDIEIRLTISQEILDHLTYLVSELYNRSQINEIRQSIEAE